MQSRSLLVFGLAAAFAVGGVAWLLLPGPKAEDDDTDEPLVVDDNGEPVDARTLYRTRRGELQAQARNLGFGERDRADSDASPLAAPGADGASAQLGNGVIDRQAAEEGFEHVMRVLEDTARDRERLSKTDWRELYRAANDAYSAMSMHLDAHEPEDREKLEAGHRRLQEALRRVRVRGRKFGPE